MKTPDQNSEWSRARGLLVEFKSAARKGVSAQILLGKELALLKKKLGYLGKNAARGPEGQFVPPGKTWDQWCQEQLGVCSKTADRYIACFDYALRRAKAHKAKNPEALRLLVTPAAELTGDELDLLAAHVGHLVEHFGADGKSLTQSQILDELGISKAPRTLIGGDTSEHRKATDDEVTGFYANTLFGRIRREMEAMEKSIFRTIDHQAYQILLAKLPLNSPDPEAPTLIGIKESLEQVFTGRLARVLEDVKSAIEAKMQGPPPKRAVRKSSTPISR